MSDSAANEEVRHLERKIEKHDRAMDSLYRRRRNVKKQMKNPLLSLLVVLLITAFLTSSCTLHAGELLGRWEADEVIGLWTGQLEGLLEKAKALGTAPYVIASVVLTVINLPVGLCGMFLAPLRMIEMALEMNTPAAVTYLPYVEIALILMVLLAVMKGARPFSGNRSARAELRDIDSRLQQHSRERQEANELLKVAREVAEMVHAEEEKPLTEEQVDRYFKHTMDIRLRQEIAQTIPEGIDPAALQRFYAEDSTKTLAAAVLIRDILSSQPEQSSYGKATAEEQYLAGFDRVFHALSDEEVYAILAASQEMAADSDIGEDE